MTSRLLLLWLVLLPLAGCGLMPARLTDSDPLTGAANADLSAELHAAETALAETPQDSVLKEKVATLRKQVKTLETETLASAEKLWAGQQPGAALIELDKALQTLPASSVLQRRRTYYAELLQRRLELPRAEQKLVRGRYVADSLRVERQIATIAPGSNSATLAALEHERKALADEIQAIGINALERRLFGFARWAFNLAGDLGVADAAKRLAEVNQREKQKAKKAAPIEVEPELSEQQVLEGRLQLLKQQLDEALNKRDGLRARKVLTELQRLFPTEPNLGQYQQRLKPLVQEQASNLEADGNRRYRDGDIAGALVAWKQALALAPEHKELPGQIARAEKVQANLNSLRNHSNR